MILLGAVSLSATVALFFLGALAIQLLLVVWNISVVLGIIAWEKEKRRNYALSANHFSQDERWATISKEIEWIENQIQRASDERRRVLQAKLLRLKNDLRRIEWKMKEEDLDALYKSQKPSLSELNKFSRDSILPHDENADEKRMKSEKRERKYLDEVLASALEILKDEMDVSLSNALSPISNDLKAHYHEIKKRDSNSASLPDYWVALMIVQSAIARSKFDARVLKYASRQYVSHFSGILKIVDSKISYSEGESSKDDAEYLPSIDDLRLLPSDQRFDDHENSEGTNM